MEVSVEEKQSSHLDLIVALLLEGVAISMDLEG